MHKKRDKQALHTYLYGSARAGEHTLNRASNTDRHYYRVKGNRHYELTNHLGNVLAVVTDRKIAKDTTADATYTPQFFMPDVYAVQNYYAFGQSMPKWSTTATVNDPTRYRYGMNGQEKDIEIPGAGNTYTAEFWEYDARTGRRWNLDPKPIEGISLYAAFGNNPVTFTDIFGDTLRGVNELSALRAYSIIQDNFKGTSVAKFFQLSEDKNTFVTINNKVEFQKALNSLENDAQRAIAIGYFKVINSKETNIIEILKRDEYISEYGLKSLPKNIKYSTGMDIDIVDGGGRNEVANSHKGKGLVCCDENNGRYAIVVIDPISQNSKITYKGFSGTFLGFPKPGETLAHELIGHGIPSMTLYNTTGKDSSVQTSNLYLKSKGYNYFRPDHGDSPENKETFNPNGIPFHLHSIWW